MAAEYPPGTDLELVGSTRPEVLALALSGHLAAAAGGDNNIPQQVAEQVVGEAFIDMEEKDPPADQAAAEADPGAELSLSAQSDTTTAKTTSTK